jgi:hypothetical protein
MRRSSEPEERAQFTVAELLARYGGAAPTPGRRHRRAAEDSDSVADPAALDSAVLNPAAMDTAAQPVVERNWAGTREPMVRPSEPSPDSPGRHGSPYVDPPQVDLFQSYSAQSHRTQGYPTQSYPTQSYPTQSYPTQSYPTQSYSTQSYSTQPHLNGRGGPGWTPAVGPSSVVAGRVPATPPPVAGRAPLSRSAVSDGPATDQLPRLDPVPVDPAPWSSRQPASAQLASAQPSSAQPSAGLDTATRAIPEQSEDAAADEAQAQESGSPLWEWAVMVSQIGIGVVGGAALWLICEWLWQRIPVGALVVALAVITGLVWVVRRVRRAEDLQTTVIAVLVGLFVTVSPAALLLLSR